MFKRGTNTRFIIILSSCVVVLLYFTTPTPSGGGNKTCRAPYKELSYPMPDHFPFPRMNIVMETKPGTCNLFWYSDRAPPGAQSPCQQFSQAVVHEPDPHVREVFASLLTNCHLRDCQCVDIGANVGYMTVLMASMGASVISVEPYFDYGQALKRTVELNCWTDRVQVHQGFATMDAAQAGKRQWVNSTYRSMGEHVPPVVTGWNAPFINIADLIKGKSLELVKIDTDTVDGFLLKGLIELITTGNLEVKSIVTEFMAGDASILHTFQQKLGYDIYRLNVHDDRRFFDDTGHDVISHFGDIKLEPFFEERYFLRYIKFAFKLKNRPNLADWEPVIKTREGLNEATLQYLITKVALEEHQFQHPVARARPNGVGP